MGRQGDPARSKVPKRPAEDSHGRARGLAPQATRSGGSGTPKPTTSAARGGTCSRCRAP
jgi:hypothetical protein